MSEGQKRRRFRFNLRTLFAVTLAFGLWQIFVGYSLALYPHFEPYAVLNPEEKTAQEAKELWIAILENALGSKWLFWMAPGVVIVFVSSIGLFVRRNGQNE